jgi:hypothetical protein
MTDAEAEILEMIVAELERQQEEMKPVEVFVIEELKEADHDKE